MNKKITLHQLLTTMCGRDWEGRSVAFLLGAGCSITSGVPDASQLARKWLHELRINNHDAFSDVTKESVSQNYFDICRARWDNDESALNTEINRFTQARNPGAGYIAFANILAHLRTSSRVSFKTVITTNFDNLIEQAFQKYTNHAPVVIPDPTLVRFMEKSQDVNSPVTIIKIHGDSRLNSRNSEESTAEVSGDVLSSLSQRVRSGILIVIGYAGNEKGVANLIKDLVASKSIDKVYWVNEDVPGLPILNAFADINKYLIMVDHLDFDDFMLRWQERLRPLSYASSSLSEMISFRHHDRLMWKLGLYGKTNEAPISPDPSRFQDYFSAFAEISREIYVNNKPADVAHSVLKKAIEKHGENVNLMVFAGAVYKCIVKDMCEYFKFISSAYGRSPNHAGANAEMGIICREKRDLSAAIRHFSAAIENDPGDLNSRINRCGCLLAYDNSASSIDEYNKCSNDVYNPMHRLELAFYSYAREGLDKGEALKVMLSNLEKSISPNFDFSINIDSAPVERRPLLKKVAEVMNGKLEKHDVLELIRKEINQ